MDSKIVLPSKPKIVEEHDNSGIYEVDGLYPGYGHTLGNSLRRIILSSLPGAAITTVKINGVSHEFSTIEGVREDVITIMLNLKKVRFKMSTEEAQTLTLKAKGEGEVTAGDIEVPGQVEVLNPEQVIAHVTEKKTELTIEITLSYGLGFVPKDIHQKEKVDIGTIALDALFSPIRRVNYEVEKMRVGDRTDFNRLRIAIETDGTLTPKEALEKSIEIMINQLKAIVGFQEEIDLTKVAEKKAEESIDEEENDDSDESEVRKERIESLGLSTRTENALSDANIRTVGGLMQKSEVDLLDIDGLGRKGVEEIKDAMEERGVDLKEA